MSVLVSASTTQVQAVEASSALGVAQTVTEVVVSEAAPTHVAVSAPGPAGPRGEPGPSAIAGYGFAIDALAPGDLLVFDAQAWTNTPQSRITDGGNF